MKRLLFTLLLFCLVCSSAWATNWCGDANTQLCLTAEEGVTTVDDKSQNTFTVSKGVDATQSSDQAQFGTYSYVFDGTDDYLSIEDSGGILDFEGATEDFSYCLWARKTDSSTARTLGILDNNDDGWDALIADSPGTGNHWGQIDAIDVKSANSVTANTWVHLCGTFDRDGNGQMWTNGIASGDPIALSSEAMDITEQTFFVGVYNPAGLSATDYYDGYLDEIGIFSKVLTSVEINSIMDNGLVQAVTTSTISGATLSGCTIN